MNNENNINSINRPKALTHLHDEFNKSVSVPKPVLITETEAQIIADYFLNLIHGIHLTAGMCGWCHWEHHMYPYSHERLGVLIKSGLVTKMFIDDWWKANPIPEDDPSYAPWKDSIFSKDSLPDRPSSNFDSDDDIPF